VVDEAVTETLMDGGGGFVLEPELELPQPERLKAATIEKAALVKRPERTERILSTTASWASK
jgi:hypothetical protein